MNDLDLSSRSPEYDLILLISAHKGSSEILKYFTLIIINQYGSIF